MWSINDVAVTTGFRQVSDHTVHGMKKYVGIENPYTGIELKLPPPFLQLDFFCLLEEQQIHAIELKKFQ